LLRQKLPEEPHRRPLHHVARNRSEARSINDNFANSSLQTPMFFFDSSRCGGGRKGQGKRCGLVEGLGFSLLFKTFCFIFQTVLKTKLKPKQNNTTLF
jgi:hypothetical protein